MEQIGRELRKVYRRPERLPRRVRALVNTVKNPSLIEMVRSQRRQGDTQDAAPAGINNYAISPIPQETREDYSTVKVQDMAQQIASELGVHLDIRSEPTHDITRLRPVSLASVPRRIAIRSRRDTSVNSKSR
jgi:hypothetical protein